jgi:hypothetical protein
MFYIILNRLSKDKKCISVSLQIEVLNHITFSSLQIGATVLLARF